MLSRAPAEKALLRPWNDSTGEVLGAEPAPIVRKALGQQGIIMSLASMLLSQVRNPTGRLGRWNLRRMNRHHSGLTDWGLGHVTISEDAAILDIGCGGGRTLQKLAARAAKGKVYGVDASETSVALSRKTNEDGIKAGRVEILQASVSRLPFPDQRFDLATAIETHFYWEDLPAEMREVHRVLKPGGVLILMAEVYKGGKYDRRVERFAEMMQRMGFVYSNLTAEEHRDLFRKAGYSDVQVIEEYEKGWICGIGRKPRSSTGKETTSES